MGEEQLPVVLVHGLIGTMRNPTIFEAMAPRRVLAPDLLGYGEFADTPPERIGLGAQVEHLRPRVEDVAGAGGVHLVGHSVGGAVAVLFARRYPGLAAFLTSVEGNFTLADAFLSGKIARKSAKEVEAMMEADRADPGAWLERAGVAPDAARVAEARRWLENQPASTVQAMARSVVEETGKPAYPRSMRAVFDAVPVHLLAGERSRDGWGVPGWALSGSGRVTLIPKAGHFMMLEEPGLFGRTIARLLGCPPGQQRVVTRRATSGG